ncbi:hypothetical protein BU16DRAFT_154418 [Lophium mytilinum]|uniref:Uncharacterized protein n=1 Tax=Lophium mytilinum TaxID=390894 RepID=A0A6A6QEN1_9PEZI|nr:hypothetical protein BU16DRAFT_154418 [Lophium mytilinum]
MPLMPPHDAPPLTPAARTGRTRRGSGSRPTRGRKWAARWQVSWAGRAASVSLASCRRSEVRLCGRPALLAQASSHSTGKVPGRGLGTARAAL